VVASSTHAGLGAVADYHDIFRHSLHRFLLVGNTHPVAVFDAAGPRAGEHVEYVWCDVYTPGKRAVLGVLADHHHVVFSLVNRPLASLGIGAVS